ncbi:hypothetical protein [Fulvimarina sp. MAC3]|uniref:hypothetical protein n=1 Tax=Fulvimarina sp. MAC3 TaxID=3148887 RepID=UPI0031FD971C
MAELGPEFLNTIGAHPVDVVNAFLEDLVHSDAAVELFLSSLEASSLTYEQKVSIAKFREGRTLLREALWSELTNIDRSEPTIQ